MKITKEELIKALEVENECYNSDCEYENCEDCPFYNEYSTYVLIKNSLRYLKGEM